MKTWVLFLKVLDVPLTVKIRTGVQEKSNMAHKLIPEMKNWGVSMITVRFVVAEVKIVNVKMYFNCKKLFYVVMWLFLTVFLL